MAITTKRGDRGTTFMISGAEVCKDSLRVELLGTIDELSCQLGSARSVCERGDIAAAILEIQRDLVQVAGAVADPDGIGTNASGDQFGRRVSALESQIAELEESTPTVTEFRLPGADRLEALLHLARAVSRRCERCAVRLHRHEQGLNENVLIFFNRLADYLWLLARQAELDALAANETGESD